jgi:hypothetical protein
VGSGEWGVGSGQWAVKKDGSLGVAQTNTDRIDVDEHVRENPCPSVDMMTKISQWE